MMSSGNPKMFMSPTVVFLLLYFFLIVILVLVLVLLARRRSKLPVSWPVVGMAFSLVSNVHRIHDWGVNILRQTGGNFMFKGPWFLGLDFLIVADPANMYHILSLNHSNYPKGDDFEEIFDILGDGIFNSHGDSWQHQRRKTHALMGTGRFRASVARRTRDKVEKGLLPLMSHLASCSGTVDLQDVLLRLTFDLTCNIILGVDPGCLSAEFPTVPFSKAVHDAEEVILVRHTVPVSIWKLLRWLGVGQEKRLAAATEVIDGFLAEQASRIREERRDGNEASEAGLLSSYLDDHHPSVEDGKGVNAGIDTFLRDTALSLLAAGKDTTSAALTWFFFMLSKHSDVEAKIMEELRGIAPSKERGDMAVFDAEELGGLVYLHATVCETLRLFPTVPLNHKAALRDDVLPSGHRIAPGTRIIISVHAMARMEGVWGVDCEEFRPERWISEKGRLRFEPSYKFSAFSSGPRSCLGKDMAFTQMKVAAAAMVYNFEVKVVEGHLVQPKASLILLVKDGLMVKISKRRGGPGRDYIYVVNGTHPEMPRGQKNQT